MEWLRKKGIAVHLHCFEYGRERSTKLNELCASVNYYERNTSITSFLTTLPYTVKSRQSSKLKENLLRDEHPILFEVLHTTFLASDPDLKKRKKIYRHSNIEHEYYRHLAEAEKDALKKYYLVKEAAALEKYEKVVDEFDLVLAVNQSDAGYYRSKYKNPRVVYLPSFHSNEEITSTGGKGEYILYHGNLSVSENSEAAIWLLENVFSKTQRKVVIAGLEPPAHLKKAISRYAHIELVEGPDEQKMKELIRDAHVHCLYTAQATGLKLKLLNVLFAGRFVLCNDKMLAGTGLGANSSILVGKEMIENIESCFSREFDSGCLEERKKILERFSNEKNADLLISSIWND